ncbi:MAG: RNA polymerase factor sigma-32 [Deltaproteobacteria bacterium]|nr:RNA polymerase factor sigma-32 [Deltaproteobacteria bacterium]
MAKGQKGGRRKAKPRKGSPGDAGKPLLPEVLLPDAEPDDGIALETAAVTEAGDAAETGLILRRSALQRYFADIRRSKPLSREEEHKLAVRYREYGDVDAAYSLVMANLRLVVKIAMEYQSAYSNLLDLIQEGNIGLMEAVKRFNPYKDVKLSTYAAWWIRAFILRYIINNFRLVKIGTTRAQRKLFFNLNKERQRLEAMGYTATPRLLASNLDVTEKEVEEMTSRMAQPAQSLDQPMGSEGHTTLLDFMKDEAEGPEDAVAREQMRSRALEIIGEMAEKLPEKERAILDRRLLAEEPETLEQIGKSFSVSKERIRQLEARLMGRLRDTLRARLLPP